MDVLPDFRLIRPRTLDDVLKARATHADSRLLGGGTDLIVNLRRGIGDGPDVLIDMTRVTELTEIEADEKTLTLGASVKISEVAAHPVIARHYPALAEAAHSIAGPTHRGMGTVGGNICLDTRCIYYNQSEWWRQANDFCLKYQGSVCHVAPKSKVCFATFSGDLAPALLIYGAELDIAGPKGTRRLPLPELYTGDGQTYLTLEPGELVTKVHLADVPGLATGYEKMRVRRSIDYPLAGVAVGVTRDGDVLTDLRIGVTGTNPRPVLIEGTGDLFGGPLDDEVLARLDDLMRDQIMAMKTTFTPGTYRRRVAGVLARRLTRRLFDATGG